MERRNQCLLAVWLIAGCGASSPTEPTHSQAWPDVIGAWGGTYVIEQCEQQGSNDCRFSLEHLSHVHLALVQIGPRLSGELTFGDDTGKVLERGSLAGTVDLAGRVTITVQTQSIIDGYDGQTNVTDWTGALNSDRQQMTGRFVKQRRFTDVAGPQTSREEGTFTLNRQPSQ